MVDKQIQDLTADTTPASGDTVETQKVGGGAGSSKQVTIDDIITQGAPVATGSVKGVMSAADKALIDSSLFFSKVDATTAPTTTDDSGSSYEVGSVWVDVTNDKAYICLDATVSAAVWTEVTQSGGGSSDHGALTGLGDDDHTQYSLLSSGAGAPSSTPTRTGEVYVDTTNDVAYISTGTASSADWKQSSGEAVTGTSAQIIVYDGSGDIQSVTMTGDATISNTGVVTVVDANIDHGGIGGLSDDDHSQYSLLSSGAGAPGSTPTRVGEIYVDTTGDVAYVSTGTASSADWTDVSSTSPLAGTSAEIVVYDGSNVQQSVAMSGDATISNTGVVSVVDANIDHGSIGGLAGDDHTQYSLISSGAGAPGSTPSRVGEVYIDTTNDNAYLSTGTASSADWTQVNVMTPADKVLLDDLEVFAGNMLSTGWSSGGIVTINADTTKFDVSAGTGLVVDSHTDPSSPVTTPVSWSAFTAEAHLADGFTVIGINSSGSLVTQVTTFTQEELRDNISLAIVTHSGGLVSSPIQVVSPEKLLVINPLLSFADYTDSIGAVNRSGNEVTTNGVNLKLDRAEGEIFDLGGNVETSRKNPNILSIAAASPNTIIEIYQDGFGDFTATAPGTDLDTSFYDDGSGTLAALPADKYQAKRIDLFPSGNLLISYGQVIYNTLAAAIASADSEIRVLTPDLTLGVHLGYIAVKGEATDLSDMAQASILQAGNVTTVLQEYAPLGNGFTLEDIQVPITSDGGTITASVAKTGGGNFECILAALKFPFIADSVTLTAGTASVPQENFIHIVETSGSLVLTNSTSGFPSSGDFVAVATVVVQTAGIVLTDGALKVHKWADQFSNGIPNGHLAHVNTWIRQQNATWVSGAAGTITIATGPSPDDVTFDNTAGTVFQLHEHPFPARDMSTGDDIYVGNGNTAHPIYSQLTNLNVILTDTGDNSMSGKSFNLVFWGVVSEIEADCKIFVNIPTGSYNNASLAEADAGRTSVYTFDSSFKGTAFLIGRSTFTHASGGGGQWTEDSYESLLGTLPNNIAGSGQAGVTDHGGLSGLLDDDHTQYSLISSGAGAPSANADRVGETYVDTTGDLAYHSIQTGTGATDWKQSTHESVDAFKYISVEEKTANFTVLTTDRGKLFTGDGTFTFTLPVSLPAAGQDFVDILNIGTGVITIDSTLFGINQASNDTMTLGPGEMTRLTYISSTDPRWRASNDTVALTSSGSGAPGTTPLFVGEIYVDVTADASYISVGTASSADWARVLNDLVDDTTPQLGGTLDANSNPIAMGDAELQRPNIKDYSVESTAATDGATVTLDLAADGNDQTLTLTQNITLAFSNWPPTGTLGKVTFQCTQDSDTAKTVTVTNVDKWPEGTAWVMSTGLSAIDEVVFWSRDAGTTVYGAVIGQAFA